MILWIIVVLCSILILFLGWWFSSKDVDESEETNYPTVHARCRSDSTCGGDLICDMNCNRCRKKIGGNCSADMDCESGLRCREWKCTRVKELKELKELKESDEPKLEEHGKPHINDSKGVHWDETKNETYYFKD